MWLSVEKKKREREEGQKGQPERGGLATPETPSQGREELTVVVVIDCLLSEST
jgi:hypothetical protein